MRKPELRLARVFWALTALSFVIAFACLMIAGRAVAPDGFCGYISGSEMLLAGASTAVALFLFGLTIMATVTYRSVTLRLPEERPMPPDLRRAQFEPPARGWAQVGPSVRQTTRAGEGARTTGSARRGATLISVLASMAIIAICLTLVLQAYLHGGRFVELQQRRSRAAMACQAQIETARARGYAALPAPGEHTFDAGEGLEGTLVIEAGPQESSRTVTARVRWPGDHAAPGGHVELVTIMVPGGIGG